MEQNLELALRQTIVKAEDDKVFIELACKFFGINLLNQTERIRKDEICKSDFGKNHSEAVFGDKRLRLCLGKKGFIRWIQIINTAIVRKELRELFVQYQVAVFDYLYYGDKFKTAQLEDIRTYVENINSAIKVNRQVMEYITEQKQHRDLCLASPPNEWAQIKLSLVVEKELPQSTDHLKAIGSNLPNDIEKLQRIKKATHWNILSNKNRLTHQSVSVKGHSENPMPEGYQKEKTKLAIKAKEDLLEIINERIIEVSKKQLENKQQINILRTK